MRLRRHTPLEDAIGLLEFLSATKGAGEREEICLRFYVLCTFHIQTTSSWHLGRWAFAKSGAWTSWPPLQPLPSPVDCYGICSGSHHTSIAIVTRQLNRNGKHERQTGNGSQETTNIRTDVDGEDAQSTPVYLLSPG